MPAEKIRNNLLKITNNEYPIISVTQKPINFGRNMCVGEIGKSKYNEYKQILIGALEAKTKYIACVEDDVLYSPDHFEYRPPADIFAYDNNYWFAQIRKDFYWRASGKMWGMLGCIVETKELIRVLSRRYELYPTHPTSPDTSKNLRWGEPGFADGCFGISSNHIGFWSKTPSVVFVHEVSMGYKQLLGYRRRYGNPEEKDIKYSLRKYGSMKDLWKEYWENG
jgi:hypothetical protein